MRVRSSEAISGFLKVYRLGRSSCWLSEGEEVRVEPVRDLWVARAPVTAEDQAALRTDVLAGYVFAQAAAGAGKAWQEAATRRSRASSRLLASHWARRPHSGG
jgi:hypothetical protein